MLCTRVLKGISTVRCTLIPARCTPTLTQRTFSGLSSWGTVGTLPNCYVPSGTLLRLSTEAKTEAPMLMSCNYCTASTTDVVSGGRSAAKQTDGILKRVLHRVGLGPNSKSRLKVASIVMYESVADKINYLMFFRDFNLPNTFNSWFLVTELHVWMLLLRSMAEGAESGEDGRLLRNCIVEAMWGDVNTRAKKLGAHNPSRTRQQIEVLSEQFQAALIAYDEGVMSDDRVLASALWRRFFEMNCEDYTKVERLVKYVRLHICLLDQLSRDEFLVKPRLPWMALEKITVP